MSLEIDKEIELLEERSTRANLSGPEKIERALEAWKELKERLPHPVKIDRTKCMYNVPEILQRFMPEKYPKLGCNDYNILTRKELEDYDSLEFYVVDAHKRMAMLGGEGIMWKITTKDEAHHIWVWTGDFNSIDDSEFLPDQEFGRLFGLA